MGLENVTFALAFVAGIVSFASPCCLPLVPTYVTYLTGSSVTDLSGEMSSALRRRLILNALAFIGGFSVVFIVLGLGASTAGSFLQTNMTMLRQVSGIVVVAFGLYLMGFLNFSFLARERRLTVVPGRAGLRNSFLIGAAFSAGWSPCVGPVLGGILFLASQSGSVVEGGVLLAFYSLGLGLPFFLTALSLGWFIKYLPRIQPHMGKIRFGSGVLMVIIGLMIYFNYFIVLNQYFNLNQAIGL